MMSLYGSELIAQVRVLLYHRTIEGRQVGLQTLKICVVIRLLLLNQNYL